MYVVFVLDPMGLISAADRFSTQAFLKLYAPFHSTEAREDILVVLIEDEDLPLWPGASPEGWPPSYGDYDCLLRTILSHRPQSVFVDLVLSERRRREPSPPPDGGEDGASDHRAELADLFRAYGKDDAPMPPDRLGCGTGSPDPEAELVLADIPAVLDVEGGNDPTRIHSRGTGLWQGFRETGVKRAMVKWIAMAGRYPLVVREETLAKGDDAWRGSPAPKLWQLHADVGDAESFKNAVPLDFLWTKWTETPAAKLCRIHCEKTEEKLWQLHADVGEAESFENAVPLDFLWTKCTATPAAKLWQFHSETRESFTDLSAMEVIWSARPHPNAVERAQKTGETCRFATDSALARAGVAGRMLGRGLIRIGDTAGDIWDIPQPCPVFDTLRARRLIELDAKGALSERIEGRHVLVGANVTAFPDMVETPVSGQIPGVFFHAMALDNLLSFEKDYPKPMPPWISNLLEIFLIGGLALVGVFAKEIWEDERKTLSRRMITVGVWFIAFLVLTIGALAALAIFKDYTPTNWAVLLGLLFILVLPDLGSMASDIVRGRRALSRGVRPYLDDAARAVRRSCSALFRRIRDRASQLRKETQRWFFVKGSKK